MIKMRMAEHDTQKIWICVDQSGHIGKTMSSGLERQAKIKKKPTLTA